MINSPVAFRRNIPFYVHKSPAAFQRDPYERYDEMVRRQIHLHFGSLGTEASPWMFVHQWIMDRLPEVSVGHFVEIGCGTGSLTAQIAANYPTHTCYGLDYSYQLLRVAHDYYCAGRPLEDRAYRGFPTLHLPARPALPNLQFGLTDATQLPFPDQSIHSLCSSFLFDRLEDPLLALREWRRVIHPEGRLLLVSPLNFQQGPHWEAFYPREKFLQSLTTQGWDIQQVEATTIEEPLDAYGNCIHWKCVMVVLVPSIELI